MTITFVSGNLLEADVDALVNTVNTKGYMGKGLALQFRRRFKTNFDEYLEACSQGRLKPGSLLLTYSGEIRPRIIINFATKDHWRGRSRLAWIEQGLDELVQAIREHGIESIAIPALGCGYGGLPWPQVRELISTKLQTVEPLQAVVYGPDASK